jgi:hypothetical protein
MNSSRLFPFLRGRAARDLHLGESVQVSAVAGEDSESAHHSGDRHVVQPQEAVAIAHTHYISSLWKYDYVKLSPVRVLGVAEGDVKEYF